MPGSFRGPTLFAWLCLCCLPVSAAPAALPVTGCGPAIVLAERSFRIPAHLLQAIAQVESGRPNQFSGQLEPWPWTINAAGAGAFFATKAQAIAAVRALQARGIRSIDVGCLQVNLMFHPAAFGSLEQAFDPSANAQYAARFLTTLRGNDSDWMRAIAAYHSQTAAVGNDYRRRVLAFWQNPAADWHLGLAVSYRDFLPQTDVYGDFAPANTVYGAFAGSGVRR